ncbi:uridine-cytidine kinase-like 1 isoform X1 [Macaca nemestrina]|uniref:uridine-cytidine kinase-like 1 isoform X1 n=1 Tax=Macaca nemestrina TaxID=9545 RepID=UPI0005F3DA32|nr:uridine-cytidine kinase-like 1 isoform X1 [Macaca nemestrina]XP_015285624.1 uridine-cytidine kinase-like 1 isoform X6 [Macaca fascicularis]XP_050602085.1 uridine-cytidine kinase-like 1 isoform X1 [Macaca thibetana thibetana]
MAAPPARADADPSPTSPPTARDPPGRQAEKSETACEDRSNAESLDRLLPPVGTGHSPRKRTTSQCKSEPPLLRTSKRTIYTAGRPPWYNEHGTQSKEAFAIGLGGGSASGKTTVARMIIEALDVPWVVLLSMDSFYKVLTEQQQEQAAHNNFNFDHPDAFDFDLIISTLKKLKQGKSVKVPVYDFTTHSRKRDWKTLYGANVIIFEGIMAFADKTLLEGLVPVSPCRLLASSRSLAHRLHQLLDMKIFVDTDSDIRLVRRLRRDISERGRDIEGVIKQYNKFVKPSFDQYIQPTMRLADIVVPRGSGNTVAIDLIVQHVHSQLEEGCAGLGTPVPPAAPDAERPEEHAAGARHAHHHQVGPTWGRRPRARSRSRALPLHFRPRRDKETSRDEFIFYSKRLMRLLIEHALSFLPFQDCVVRTPQGQDYAGKCYAGKQITGVSILRAGETMEPALRAVCKDVRIGTILIQTNQLTGEPELHYLRLPKDISDDHVILMDCTVSTGAAAMMAVRVLLDHDVPEDKIFLLSLLMAEMGVHSVAYAFPRVRIITTAVDKRVNDLFRIIPGIGNFGDRYFGTDAVPDGSDEEEVAYTG